MPNLHQFTKALGMKPDYVDPRTGELKFKAPGSWEALPSSAFSDYPIRGFDRKEVPATELYEENGATPPAPEEPTDRARRVGEGPAARTYRPGFIKQLLRREPWRRPSMTADMRATGLSDADLAEWEWDLAGRFADPDAPETPPCEISVADHATAVVIRGFDASGAPTWTAHASLDPQSGVLVADLAPSGGREGFRGQVTTALPEAFSADKLPGIMWEDGSVWERVGEPAAAGGRRWWRLWR